MKKYLAIATAALLLLCSLVSCVQVDPNAIDNYTPDINYMDTDAGTFYFAEAEGETAILTSFKSKDNKDDNVEIPERFIVKDKNGEVVVNREVTVIGDSAFYGLASLTSVKIPATITSIGKAAFARCSNLKSVELPDSVLSIGEKAFAYCESLESIQLGKSLVSIGDHAFQNCEKLSGVVFPDTLESIGQGAFWYCKGLTELTFPASLKEIKTLAFYNCQGLPTDMESSIPEGVEKGDYIFSIDENDVEEETEAGDVTEPVTDPETDPDAA